MSQNSTTSFSLKTMKITTKLQGAHSTEEAPATFSFEYFTPKTTQGVQNLYDRMDRMYLLNPLFIDITWNAGGRLSTLTSEMVHTTSTVLGLETCMHLTCTNMPVELIDDALQRAYNSGCQNILALRGDPPLDGSESTGDFKYAKDLVRHIREKYGDYFCIGVAGYPEGHPEEPNDDLTLQYLLEKQEAGGDFIVTQLFYDVDNFINWANQIKAYGVTIPIIPGIMPISNYSAFLRRAKWNEVQIPQSFIDRLEPIKDDDAAVREEGCDIISEMCTKLLQSKVCNHLHMYTMNLEKSSTMILEKLNLIQKQDKKSHHKEGELKPWRKSLNPSREQENVRPIFWANRKFSYITRTANWDEFPNGRWGDSRSPAFGSVDYDHEIIRHSPAKVLNLWGTPTNASDLGALIVRYLKDEISCLPWSDSKITNESNSIKTDLIALNSNGFLTVNSQPMVNGAPSIDPVFGWGPANGYVYQKQYLELLIPISKLNDLINRIKDVNNEEGYQSLTYYATGSGGFCESNIDQSQTIINAVTWGCFPGSEITQPTIVEKVSFLAWKDELYAILQKWSKVIGATAIEEKKENDIPPIPVSGEKSSSQFNTSSSDFVNSIVESYALVNIVDNDYMRSEGKIFQLFANLQK